jgi:hypothetical protein
MMLLPAFSYDAKRVDLKQHNVMPFRGQNVGFLFLLDCIFVVEAIL